MGRSDHYSRLEFSEGCLHVIRQPSIRIRVHPRLQVEVSDDGRGWTLLDVATRDWVYEALGHARCLDTGDFAYRSGTWWCVGEEQACFDRRFRPKDVGQPSARKAAARRRRGRDFPDISRAGILPCPKDSNDFFPAARYGFECGAQVQDRTFP
jgi:hypothetical protein